MKGASIEPCASTITRLRRSSTAISGVSHHFFRVLKNPQISLNRPIVYLISVLFIRPAAGAIRVHIDPVCLLARIEVKVQRSPAEQSQK